MAQYNFGWAAEVLWLMFVIYIFKKLFVDKLIILELLYSQCDRKVKARAILNYCSPNMESNLRLKIKLSIKKQSLMPNMSLAKPKLPKRNPVYNRFFRLGLWGHDLFIDVYPAVPVFTKAEENMPFTCQRAESFMRCPRHLMPLNVNRFQLAVAGFFYDEKESKILCAFCGKDYPNHYSDCLPQAAPPLGTPTTTGEDVGVRMRPRARATVRDPKGMLMENQLSESRPARMLLSQQPGTTSGSIMPLHTGAVVSTPTDFSVEMTRRNSFTDDWNGPPAEMMSRCGLYQINNDQAKCHFCQEVFGGLTFQSNIWGIHRQQSPECAFIRQPTG